MLIKLIIFSDKYNLILRKHYNVYDTITKQLTYKL